MAKGIEVHIHLHGDKAILPEPPMEQPEESDGLVTRLANKDESDGESIMNLTADVCSYVKRMKAVNDMKRLRKFLCEENRAMMTAEMKELISEILK